MMGDRREITARMLFRRVPKIAFVTVAHLRFGVCVMYYQCDLSISVIFMPTLSFWNGSAFINQGIAEM
jgi:hypothetical protein